MEHLVSLQKYSRLTEIWLPENPSKFYYILRNIRYVITAYYCFGILMYPLELMQDPKTSIQEYIDILFIIITVLNLLYNTVATILLRDKMIRLLTTLTDNRKFGNPPQIEIVYRNTGRLTALIAIYIGANAIFNALKEMATYPRCQNINHRDGRDVTCGYTVGLYYFDLYSVKTGVLWYMHIVIQFYTGIYLCVGGSAFSWSMITSIELIIAKMDHLNLMIAHCVNTRTIPRREKRRQLGVCVSYHVYIIELVDELSDVYLPLLSAGVLNYSVLIGLQLLSLSIGIALKAIINIVAWVAVFFIMCFSAERLSEKSTSIATEIYFTNWYEVDTYLRKDLKLMLMRSQLPLKITVGYLGVMELSTFKMVMQGAYTYATMRSNFD